MQLNDRSGICCDSCGITYRTDFSYYSFDFHAVAVNNNQRSPIDIIIRSQIVFSVDICTNCFEAIKKSIVDNYNKVMAPKRATKPSAIVTCEMTGKKLFGTYEYYYCVVSKADIKMSGQPNICVKCKTKTFDNDKPCSKCSGKEFIRVASMNIDQRHVEISMCEEAYRGFVTKAETVRKTAGQWTTKS